MGNGCFSIRIDENVLKKCMADVEKLIFQVLETAAGELDLAGLRRRQAVADKKIALGNQGSQCQKKIVEQIAENTVLSFIAFGYTQAR